MTELIYTLHLSSGSPRMSIGEFHDIREAVVDLGYTPLEAQSVIAGLWHSMGEGFKGRAELPRLLVTCTQISHGLHR